MTIINQKKEAILIALFFSSALLILATAPIGILSYPGIIAALAGIYFSIKGKYFWSASIGVLATVISFLGQSLTFHCSSCTLSALCFLIAGMLSLLKVAKERPIFSIGLCSLAVCSTLLFAVTVTGYVDTRSPVIMSSNNAVVYAYDELTVVDKPLLYLSVTCNGCRDIIHEFIKIDSKGENWQPVIVPHGSLKAGEEMLANAGYKGNILTAAKPPSNRVPVLETKDNILIGKDIRLYLEGME